MIILYTLKLSLYYIIVSNYKFIGFRLITDLNNKKIKFL